ncbi:MAG: hypothetical protein ACKV2V_26375 [Blastocatellia bacterium]
MHHLVCPVVQFRLNPPRYLSTIHSPLKFFSPLAGYIHCPANTVLKAIAVVAPLNRATARLVSVVNGTVLAIAWVPFDELADETPGGTAMAGITSEQKKQDMETLTVLLVFFNLIMFGVVVAMCI